MDGEAKEHMDLEDKEAPPFEDTPKEQDYVIKNPNSVGCKTSLHGGATLKYWEIEEPDFYAKEGKVIGTRNLWASIPNLLMGFAVWLMWSVTIAAIQKAHTADPNAYYFQDFAPEYRGVSDGFRGCPGWYDYECCDTWKAAPEAQFLKWQASASLSANYPNANTFMDSQEFHEMSTAPKGSSVIGFSNFTSGGDAYGCPVSVERKKAYKAVLYV
eukprot:CAMPEP_0119355902 /NCGR_PEP_ID=MMETSP1334-20130426/4673_1 /TAXON_ID=127549 /ORGANISM="Calcidiscus leptoporus, Strain RCC1130" /LENGTH=213 /DNA_ID=CAMNT_0007369843 /DNA_START=53 /DNA_END=691 /DNA_ORIENTATION=-